MLLKDRSNYKSIFLVLQTPLEILYTVLVIRSFGFEAFGTFQKLVLPSTILTQFTTFGINPAALYLLNKSTQYNSLTVIKSAFILQLPIVLILSIPIIFFPEYLLKLSGLSEEWYFLLFITTSYVALSAFSKPFYCILLAQKKPLKANIISQTIPAFYKFFAILLLILFAPILNLYSLNSMSYVSLLTGLLLSSRLISWIFLAYEVIREWPNFESNARISSSNNLLRAVLKLLKLSLPSGVSGNILKVSYTIIDVTCSNILNSVQFGSYSLVKSFLSVLTILERPIETSISSILSNSRTSDFKYIINFLSSVSFFLYTFASVGFIIFGYFCISVVFPELDASNMYIATLCGLIYVSLLSQISYLNSSQSQQGKPHRKIYPRLSFLFTALVISYPLVTSYSFTGAIISLSCCSISAYIVAIAVDINTIKSFTLPFKFLSVSNILKIWKNPYFVKTLLGT